MKNLEKIMFGVVVNNIIVEFLSPVPKEIETFLKEGFTNQSTQLFGYDRDRGVFSFILKDEDKLVGAVVGIVFLKSLYVKDLFVLQDYRGKGFGKLLMEKALAYAKKEGASFSYLETFSFQNTKIFYEKLGFIVDFERKGYEGGAIRYYMSKKL